VDIKSTEASFDDCELRNNHGPKDEYNFPIPGHGSCLMFPEHVHRLNLTQG
jgi:hypothetical protein